MKYKLTTIREIIGDVLCAYGENDERIFVVDSDLAKSTTTNKFQNKYPNRFVETGISEQNAMSITSGLAMEGKIPFYVNFAMFVSGTCWTQVRQACYANLNVKLIATHPGMDGGSDEATHHANEDIALMRVLPNMTVLIPSNHSEFKACVKLAIEIDGPVYIRAARDVVPDLQSDDIFEIGKSITVNDDGDDYAIIYDGSTTDLIFKAHQKLLEKGKKGKLINAFSIKPFDTELIRRVAKNVDKIVTVENHSILGGLGSLVAETICSLDNHAPLEIIGVNDVFTESGPSQEIKEKYGLKVENIINTIM